MIQADPSAPCDLATQAEANPYGLDYLCILDFEATCEERNPADYIHEVIEFPVLLLNLKTLQIVRVWLHNLYVNPLIVYANGTVITHDYLFFFRMLSFMIIVGHCLIQN